MWITSSPTSAKKPTKIALGNFDGVHLGHQHVIEPVLTHKGGLPSLVLAEDMCLQASAASGYSHLPGANCSLLEPPPSPELTEWASVVTFFPHPKEFFSGQARPLLTPLEEKSRQLACLGVNQLVLLPFNAEMANLDATTFVERVLIHDLQATHISVGSDFHFGKGRGGNAELLSAIAARHNIPVTVVPLRNDIEGRISSSRIRQALTDGELARANQLLGRPYTLTGVVIPGKQLGRTIGFPTANLKLPSDKFIPRQGVYSVKAFGILPEQKPVLGVMNIGNRPTVAGQDLSVEVHLFDWTNDLYGETLTVSLESFIRPEQKFDSLDALKEQIAHDCKTARAMFEGCASGGYASAAT
ncbi:bifunctional riboflavin kinase/FAD synthetase [Leptolyngbya cf. ectocarpi LEGE 11479]|uniref:Riboflavin biosynthesis protein n=1 Tax=Leptolyngbya cf. ectocarpi LEGE 11479 TaxID=1828722 RepID=A0A928ZS99_LEPEC|nr:bifunctional riboflavin kinase/FAD synthetase [Leptolyngbya ectocarpi]MBE9065877.1 bifunctional riboflavin kinase/FAD synthetase [Leptolyngbya cf. ectocarpi LEGE 11479]